MHKEQYDNFRETMLEVQHWQIALIQLVDSLRKVARAARRAEEELRHHVDEDNPEDSLGWCLKQLETLDALPAWILEE